MEPDLDCKQFAAAELLLAPEYVMLREGPVRDLGVMVSGGKFRDVGLVSDLMQRHPHVQAVKMSGKLVMPGFIDTHHHLTQSFGKALAFGEPSEIFRRIWVPMEAALDAHAAYLAAKLSALESLRGGFTTVVDAGTRSEPGLDAVATAAREAG